MYVDINGKKGYRLLKGTSGKTYGNLKLLSEDELAAALDDGITEVVLPVPQDDPPEIRLEAQRASIIGAIHTWFQYSSSKPVTINNIVWAGGYEEAQRKDAGRRLAAEVGKPTFTFYDKGHVKHNLNKAQADQVVQGLALAYETLYEQYQDLLRQAELATQESELPAVPSTEPIP